MQKPSFGSFYQLAWVTNDMERSMAYFRDVYGIPSFLVMEQSFDAVVGEKKRKHAHTTRVCQAGRHRV